LKKRGVRLRGTSFSLFPLPYAGITQVRFQGPCRIRLVTDDSTNGVLRVIRSLGLSAVWHP
jgi:hypothetical protein